MSNISQFLKIAGAVAVGAFAGVYCAIHISTVSFTVLMH